MASISNSNLFVLVLICVGCIFQKDANAITFTGTATHASSYYSDRGANNYNYGNFSYLITGILSIYGSTYYYDAWVRFDLTQIPLNAILSSATLTMQPCDDSCGFMLNSCTSHFSIDACSDTSWQEMTILYTNAPTSTCTAAVTAPGPLGCTALPPTPSGTPANPLPWSVDITSVGNAFRNSGGYVSFHIYSNEAWSTYKSIRYVNAPYPSLQVEWTPAPTPPPITVPPTPPPPPPTPPPAPTPPVPVVSLDVSSSGASAGVIAGSIVAVIVVIILVVVVVLFVLHRRGVIHIPLALPGRRNQNQQQSNNIGVTTSPSNSSFNNGPSKNSYNEDPLPKPAPFAVAVAYNPFANQYPPPGGNQYPPPASYPPPGANQYPPPASYPPPGGNSYPPPASYPPPGGNSYPPPATKYPPPGGSQSEYQAAVSTSAQRLPTQSEYQASVAATSTKRALPTPNRPVAPTSPPTLQHSQSEYQAAVNKSGPSKTKPALPSPPMATSKAQTPSPMSTSKATPPPRPTSPPSAPSSANSTMRSDTSSKGAIPNNMEIYKPTTGIISEEKKRRQEMYGAIGKEQRNRNVTSVNNQKYQSVLDSKQQAELKKLSLEIGFKELTMENQLGEGEYAVVVAAKYKGKKVAVKLLKKSNDLGDANADSKNFSDFLSEAMLMAKLPPSPHVLQLVGFSPSPFCLVSEFMDSGALREYLDSEVVLRVSDLLRFLKDICMGLNHLHKNSIVHRDLATRNVLLKKVNGKPHPQGVLSDMGLARLAGNGARQTQSMVLPLKWCSPESLKTQTFSIQTDMWSYAITAIEVLTRDYPFPESTAMDAAIDIANRKLLPEIPRGLVPLNLQKLFDLAFSYEPSKRPDTNAFLKEMGNIN